MATATAKRSEKIDVPEPASPAPPALGLERLIVGTDYNGLGTGFVSILLKFEPWDSMRRVAESVVRDIRTAREAVREPFRGDPTYQKLLQLEASRRDTEAALADAQRREQDAAGRVQAAIANLDDPRPHEKAKQAAEDDARVIGLRLQTLQPLVAQAQRVAFRTLTAKVEQVEEQLREQARARVADLSRRLLEAIAPVLPELHRAQVAFNGLWYADGRRNVLTDVGLPEG